MPSIKKQQIQRLYLPSTKDQPDEADRSYIDVKSNLLLSDMMALSEAENETAQTFALLSKVIVGWNITAEDETEPLPITPENLDAYAGQHMDDFQFIGEWVGEHVTQAMKGMNKTEKADFLGTSTPDTENHPPII